MVFSYVELQQAMGDIEGVPRNSLASRTGL